VDGASDNLLDLLDLKSAAQGVFLGPPSIDARSRVFGGQVLAQALAAASFTVKGLPCHSLHAYFLRPGKPGRPIEYEVSSMRDGQSFVTRKVMAVQRDELNLELTASFQNDDPGAGFQRTMPDTPLPETFPSEDERLAKYLATTPPAMHERIRTKRPIESIRVGAGGGFDVAPGAGPVRTWMRARGTLVDDPNLHRCALAYASDLGAIEPSLRAIGMSFTDAASQVASLDHAMWFHRPFRFDDWLLFVFESDSVAGGRGLTRGSVYSRDGKLVASIAQEAVMRLHEAEAAY
jgi:acyl-CoA thioesterase-2